MSSHNDVASGYKTSPPTSPTAFHSLLPHHTSLAAVVSSVQCPRGGIMASETLALDGQSVSSRRTGSLSGSCCGVLAWSAC